MKSVLLSVRPEWVAKILNGEKTIEIRKTLPKCDFPIDVYIYCTKDKKYANLINRGGFLTGMVVAKFTLNKVEEIFTHINKQNGDYWYHLDTKPPVEGYIQNLCKKSCLKEEELHSYLKGKKGYAWHIDNLVVFDKPKELAQHTHDNSSMFYTKKWDKVFKTWRYGALTRAPQSYCFIEV